MLDTVTNHIIWYSKSKDSAKYRPLFRELTRGSTGATRYNSFTERTFEDRPLTKEERSGSVSIDDKNCFFNQGLTSRSGGESTRFPVQFAGKMYRPTAGGWRTGIIGMERVLKANRVALEGRRLTFKKYFGDFGCISISNFWSDLTGGVASRTDPKVYVVQTSTKIIQRCILMTTDPGDLVLDPTCGSGTTAYVAESYGRRWIAIDTSRVAVALTRQRLLTSTYDYYKLKDESEGVAGGFVNKMVPHITLRSIAQNTALDPIFARHEPILEEKLETLNATLTEVTPELRTALLAKLAAKERREGRRAITDADRRRWQLPDTAWEEWEVPFETDPDWPEALQEALTDYREAYGGERWTR